MNKNFLLIFNIVLLILVIVLFYFQFSGNTNKAANTTKTVPVVGQEGVVTIAYFEMDSIENNYEYLKDVRVELRTREQQLTSQLNAMKKNYVDKVNKFRQEGQSMSQERQGAMQEDLMSEQNLIQTKEQALGSDLQDESIKKMQSVNKKIEDFLKEFNSNKKYTYILANQPGSIYYKDERFDITGPVLEGLNASYKKAKAAK